MLIVAAGWCGRSRKPTFRARVRPGERIRDPAQWKWITVIGWTGLRGIVSLAAALALPLRDAHGAPFPQRAAIIFITFCVIVITLVGQGLSLLSASYAG